MEREIMVAGAVALVWLWRRDRLAAVVMGLVAAVWAVGEDRRRSW